MLQLRKYPESGDDFESMREVHVPTRQAVLPFHPEIAGESFATRYQPSAAPPAGTNQPLHRQLQNVTYCPIFNYTLRIRNGVCNMTLFALESPAPLQAMQFGLMFNR